MHAAPPLFMSKMKNLRHTKKWQYVLYCIVSTGFDNSDLEQWLIDLQNDQSDARPDQ